MSAALAPVPAPPASETRVAAAPAITPKQAVAQYQGLVFKLARSFANSTGVDVDDLAQEGRVGILDAVTRWREDAGGSLTTFLYTCVRNRMVDLAKRERRRGGNSRHDGRHELPFTGFVSIDDENTSEPGYSIDDLLLDADALARLRGTLTGDDRRLVERRLEGATFEDIAAELGVSEATVLRRELRIVERLRERFGGEVRP